MVVVLGSAITLWVIVDVTWARAEVVTVISLVTELLIVVV